MSTEINFIGLTAALAVFLGIWLGHISVRRIERISRKLWPPMLTALVFGFSLEAWSLTTQSRLLSTAVGILGITLLWDALEFVRQEKRIQRGHAPANPNNSRHVLIMAEYPDATTHNLLARNPIGRPVPSDEIIQLVID
jgi:hypothetical protein